MSGLPANIRVNVRVPFPTLVQGANFIGLSKSNGVWTIQGDYTQLASLLALADLPTAQLAIYDPLTKQYNTVTVAQLIASGLSSYRVQVNGGTVIVGASDVVILMDQAVPAAVDIQLPASAARNGIPVTVKDYAGVSNANPLTFVPLAGESIDGFSAAAAAANGAAVLNTNYGKKTVYPLTQGGWFL